MSHITDGDLHAYLDQALDAYGPSEPERIRAHLESCAACAQRLDAARALRERATGILGGAGPGAVSLASLEELKARAAATGGPAARTSRSRLSWRSPYAIGLGWAATITLALFAGYSVKDRAPNPSGRRPEALAPAQELDAVSAVEQPAGLDERADQFPASKREAKALGLLSSGGAVRGGAAVAGVPADTLAKIDTDRDVAAVDERRAERAALVSPREAPAALRADQPDQERQRRNRDEFRAAERIAAERARRVARPAVPAAFDDAPANEARRIVGNDTVTIGPDEPADVTFELSPRLVESDAMVVTASRAAGLGEPLVPDLELRRIDRVELPGMGQGMLIVQILPTGGDLELWSLATSELAAASPGTDLEDRAAEITAYFRNSLPRGWSMTVRERPGGYLVARAPLPQEELDVLMDRVPDGG